MEFSINPGTGALAQATEENAISNIRKFIKDCDKKEPIHFVRIPENDDAGRFAFLLWKTDCCYCHHVDMPGLELSRVRVTDPAKQNVWDFPRLYIDGSSWLWYIATGCITFGEEDEG